MQFRSRPLSYLSISSLTFPSPVNTASLRPHRKHLPQPEPCPGKMRRDHAPCFVLPGPHALFCAPGPHALFRAPGPHALFRAHWFTLLIHTRSSTDALHSSYDLLYWYWMLLQAPFTHSMSCLSILSSPALVTHRKTAQALPEDRSMACPDHKP